MGFCDFGAAGGCLSQMLFPVWCVIRAGFIRIALDCKAAPKAGPKHVQKFCMRYTCGKGFTAEYFQCLNVFLQAAVPQLWALSTDCEPYMPISGSNISWAYTDMNVWTSMVYTFLPLLVSSEGTCRQNFGPNNARCRFRTFFELYRCYTVVSPRGRKGGYR